MTSRDCRSTESLLGRPRHQLSEAQRLRLEQHLETCRACQQQQAASKLVRDVMHDIACELSSASRERLLQNALSAEPKAKPNATRHAAWPWYSALGAALAACLIGGYVLWPKRESVAPRATAPAASTAVAANDAEAVPASPAAETWLDSTHEETKQFAHARVTLAPTTRVRFNNEAHTLTLAAGSVDVEVDASRGQAFRVQTAHFRVEVLGTHFVVTPDRVEVRHGKVEVRDETGEARLALLGANETYDRAQQSKPVPVEVPHPSEVPRGASARDTAVQTIEQAQAALASGHAAEARSLLSRLRPNGLARAQRAEIATLLAEVALLERDPHTALTAYRDVARRYADLRAGENAAFAAAQLAGRVKPEEERELLEQYLKRHPKGRFAREANARRDKLTK